MNKSERIPNRMSFARPKGGRPILCVKDENGQPVFSRNPEAYLCFDSGTNRYYAFRDSKTHVSTRGTVPKRLHASTRS